MEEPSGSGMKRLLRQLEDAARSPWPAQAPGAERHSTGIVERPCPSPAMGLIGVERRLIRRAENRWRALARNGRLPPAAAVAAMLQPPFHSRALLLLAPLANPVRITFLGEELQQVSGLETGPVSAQLSVQGRKSSLGQRLVTLALSAARAQSSLSLESDQEAESMSGGPSLLIRASALPFAISKAGTPVVVVASWRTLLSAEETAAVHRELELAIKGLQKLKRQP